MVKKAGDIPYEIIRMPFDNAIDADGHVCEPADLWDNYLEVKYKPRGIRIAANKDGLEDLIVDGKVVEEMSHGMISAAHAIGEDEIQISADRTYMGTMPYGACDPTQRLDLLTRENLSHAILYPSIGLYWEHTLGPDAELSLALMRAYNRWIADFCRNSRGRMVPTAQITLLDVEGSVREIERAVKDGCKGIFFTASCPERTPAGDSRHDPIFRKIEELGIPLAIHISLDPPEYLTPRYDLKTWGGLYYMSLTHQQAQQVFSTFFTFGAFDRFPKMKVGVLESTAGWIGSYLERMDELFPGPIGRNANCKEKASTYFERQCFISADPDEKAAALVMDFSGAHCFIWGSDYPHPEGKGSWARELLEMIEVVPPHDRKLFLGENAKRIYNL